MPFSSGISMPSWLANLCKPTQAETPPASAYVDASNVTDWINKFDTALPRLEKISNNGLYSILEKEVQNITPLLNEGLKISSSTVNALDVSSMINDQVRPRLAQLQTAYTDAQKKVAEHPDEKKKDEEYEKLWNEKFQLPQSVLENHADCARFLKESGLLFNIVGYRESRPGSNEHDVKLDPLDQHPMIRVQGQYVRWETLAKELHYDETSQKIKSQSYPGDVVQSWNYFQNGLVPIDRNDCEKAFPIWETTQEEHECGLAQSKEFYKTNPEKDPGLPKTCFVRFYTNDRRALPGTCLLDNAERNFPGHIGIEVWMDDRKMYQFGFALTPEDHAFTSGAPFSNAMATGEGKIGMLDFMALKPYNKIYTSVPLTKQRALNILNHVNELKGQQLRFQYPRQNCTQLVSEVLNIAGYDVDMRTNARDVVLSIFPSLNQIAFIAKIESVAKEMWNKLPTFVTKPFEFSADVILYVPRKIGTVVTNLLMWKMGGGKKTTPLRAGAEDEEFYDKKGFQSFSTLIRNWKDIFKDETNAVYHSKYFIDWQNKQKSTFYYDYEKSGRPKVAILPEKVQG